MTKVHPGRTREAKQQSTDDQRTSNGWPDGSGSAMRSGRKRECCQLIASAWKDIGDKRGGSRGEKKGVKEHNAHQKRVNSNAPIRVWAGTKNSRSLGFLRYRVGIVRKVLSTQTQLSHKHHHHGGAVCPSYGVVSLDTPDRTQTTSSKGVGQECFGLV